MASKRKTFAAIQGGSIRKTVGQSVVTSLMAALLVNTALAGPVGGQVAAGSASIAGQGTGAVNITQSSQNVVINWNSFDTNANESVNFQQPNSNAIALNRVLSGSPTQFNGSLNANGKVIVMNGNGVVFGSSAKVDVGGLIATSADVNTEQFMGGGPIDFNTPGNGNAAIVNKGSITARDGGLVGFVAPTVENSGVIQANLGKVQLASGDSFTYDFYGDGLVQVKASDAVNAQLIQNSGTIKANGGTILMSVAQARDIVDSLVSNTGVLEAKAVEEIGGTIILKGADDTDIVQTGTIDVSGTQGGDVEIDGRNILFGGTIDATGTTQQGGTVIVRAKNKLEATSGTVIDVSGATGGHIIQNAKGSVSSGTYKAVGTDGQGGTIDWGGNVSLLSGKADASGKTKGGTIRLGGTWKNQSAGGWDAYDQHLDASTNIFVSTGSELKAKATGANGDGGEIVVRAQDKAYYAGSLDTTPGSASGKGGRAEISGGNIQLVDGNIIKTGDYGRNGELLLDPKNITITNAAADAVQTVKIGFAYAGANDQFGQSIAMNASASILAVGAIQDDTGGTDRGAVYLFSLNPLDLTSAPVLQQKITSATPGITISNVGNLGRSVAFNASGNLLAVGAMRDSTAGSQRGSVFLLGVDTNNLATTVVVHKKLESGVDGLTLTNTAYFGGGVALNAAGDILAVGSERYDAPGAVDSGAAYIFSLDTTNFSNAAVLKQIVARGNVSGLTLGTNNWFGTGIALNATGNILAVGTLGESSTNGGAAYLFNLNTADLTQSAVLRKKITNGVGGISLTANDGFGFDVALNGVGDVLLAGAYNADAGRGAVYVLSLNENDLTVDPTIIKRIGNGTSGVTLAAGDMFGIGVTMSADGSIMAIGAKGEDNGGSPDVGTVRLFDLSPLTGETGFGYSNNAPGSSIISATLISQLLGAGNNLTLQANNDITVSNAITVNNPSGNGANLTLQAGRSVLFNASVTTDSGNLTVIANDLLANGVVDTYRDAGNAVISMGVGTTLNAGTGTVQLIMRDGAGKTNRGTGDITLYGVTSNGLLIEGQQDVVLNGAISVGGAGTAIIRANDDVISNAGDVTTQGGEIVLNSNRDGIGNGGIWLNNNVDILSNGGNITLAGGTTASSYAVGSSASNASGVYLVNSIVNASGTSTGGNIIVLGRGWSSSTAAVGTGVGRPSGIVLNGSDVRTNNNGTLTMTGQGDGQTTGSGTGILMSAGSLVQVAKGDMTITGYGGGTGTGAYREGVVIGQNGVNTFEATDSGNITIFGRGANTSTSAGIVLNVNSGGGVISRGGNVTLTGIATNSGSTAYASNNGTGGTIGGVNATGTITLIGNDYSMNPAQYIRTTGDIVIKPYDANITIGNAASGADLNLAAAITNRMTWGGTLYIGGGADGISNAGNITFNNSYTFAGNVSILTPGTLSISTALSMAAGKDMTLTANNLTLTNNLNGTGNLTVQAYDPTRSVYINYGADDGSNLNITTAEKNRFTNGWNSITIGRADSTAYMDIGASTWTDSLVLRSRYVRVRGALTTESLAFQGWGVEFQPTGTITTGGQGVSFQRDVTFYNGAGSISTSGGAVSIGQNLYFNNLSSSGTIDTSGGNITITGNIGATGGSLAGKTLTLNASIGVLSVGGTTNGDFNLFGNAQAINFGGAIGSVTGLGDFVLSAINSMNLPSVTTQAGKSVLVTLSGAGSKLTTAGINVGVGGSMALTADDMQLNGNLVGTNNLYLRTNATNRMININSGTDDGSTMHLTSAEMGQLVDGWGNIEIGRADSSGLIQTHGVTFVDPVVFQQQIVNYGTVAGTGNASLVFNKLVYGSGLAAAYTTNGQAITFNDTLAMYGPAGSLDVTSNGGAISFNAIDYYGGSADSRNLTINSGFGNIAFNGTINGDYNLTASGNAMSFAGAIGSVTGLGNVTLTATNSLVLPSIATQSGKTVSATVTGGGNSITSTTISTGTGGNIALTADNIAINGNLSGTGNLTLQQNDINRGLAVNYGADDGSVLHLSTAELARFVNGWGNIYVGNNSALAQTTIGASNWTDPVTFRSNFRKEVRGTIAGTGDSSVTLTGGWLDLYDNITTAGGNIEAQYVSYIYVGNGAGVDLISNGGDVTIGRILASPVGGMNVTTSGGDIKLLDPWGAGHVMADSMTNSGVGINYNFSAGTGSIEFGSVVDGTFNLSASGQSIVFNGAIGPWRRLGNVSLVSVDSMTTPSITASNVFIRTTGASSTLTLGNGTVIDANGAGTNITLVTGNDFARGTGAALNSNSGRFLVYLTDAASTSLNGLTADFNRYTCSYGACSVSVPVSGNGFLYAYTPILNVTPDGKTITYGDAFNLNNYGYTVSGYLAGDNGAGDVTGTLNGSTNYALGGDVGNYQINYGSGTLVSAMGYGFNYQNAATALTVDRRVITVALTGSAGKVYDGNTNATLDSADYTLGNVYGSDNVLVSNTAGTYDDKNVGAGKTVTVNGLALGGSKANNYTLNGVTSTSGAIGEVTQASLTITANDANKVYGQAHGFTGAEFTQSGLIAGDNIASVILTSAGSAATATVAGGPYAIVASGASGTGLGNYAISYVSGTLTVNKANLSVTANDATKTYGQTVTFNGSEFTSSGLLNSDSITSVGLTSAGAGAGATVAGGPYDIVAGSAVGSGLDNYNITYNDGTLTINKAALTVTANDATKTYGQTVTFNGTEFSTSGLVNSDSITSVGLSSAGAGAGATVAGGPYDIVAGSAVGSGLDNYTISYVDGTLTVNKANLSITANDASKTYGQTVTFNGTEFVTSGLVNSDSVTSINLSSAGAGAGATVAGGPYDIVGAGAVGSGLDNYNITYNDGTLTINKATLTVTANDTTKTYGQTVTFNGTEFTSSGLLNSDSISSVGLVSAGAAATATVAGGPYAIGVGSATGSGLDNYNVFYVSGTLTVNKANLSVTANNANKTYGQTVTFNGTEFTSSGLLNSDSITTVGLTSAGAGAGATVAGGPYDIEASGAAGSGLNNYNITYNDGTLTINKAALTVTANDATKTYGQTVTFNGTEFTSSGLLNSDSITTVGLTSAGAGAGATVAGGPYDIVAGSATGSGLDNYTISYVDGTLTVNKANLSITANDTTKTYGQTVTFNGTEFTSSGLLNSDSIATVGLTSAGAGANATVAGGPYAIAAGSAVGTGLDNYNITYNDGTLTINKAALTVTANNASKTYGQTVTFNGTEFSTSGLVNSDNITSVGLTSAGAGAGATVAGGPYAIVASGAAGSGLDNYTISYVNGSLTVNQAVLNVTANNASKTYGQTVTFNGTEFTSSGLLNGDTLTSVVLTSVGAGAGATVAGGPYAIVASGASGSGLGNYTVNYINGTLTVGKANVMVTANNATKTYGQTVTFNGTEFTSSGLLNGDTISSVALMSAGAGAGATVAGGPYAIAAGGASGSGLDNYNVFYVSGNLTVNKANLTVTASNGTKTYGQNHLFAGTEFSTSGLVNGDTVTHVDLVSAGASSNATVAGGPYAINASNATGSGVANYNVTYVAGSLTVSQAILNIIANSVNKQHNTNYVFTGTEFTTSGLVNGDNVMHVDLTSLGSTSGAAEGPYAINGANATGSGLGNYNIVYTDGIMQVGAPAPIVAPAIEDKYQQLITPPSNIPTEGAEAQRLLNTANDTIEEANSAKAIQTRGCLYSMVGFYDLSVTGSYVCRY